MDLECNRSSHFNSIGIKWNFLISRWGFALRLQLLLFLNKEWQNTIMEWKWSSEHQVWVNFNRPVTFASGSLSGAGLNECSDPHYPLKDMLIAAAFTALPNLHYNMHVSLRKSMRQPTRWFSEFLQVGFLTASFIVRLRLLTRGGIWGGTRAVWMIDGSPRRINQPWHRHTPPMWLALLQARSIFVSWH